MHHTNTFALDTHTGSKCRLVKVTITPFSFPLVLTAASDATFLCEGMTTLLPPLLLLQFFMLSLKSQYSADYLWFTYVTKRKGARQTL